MTDQLVEQAEREIAEKLGFTSGVKYLYDPLVMHVSVGAARAMWEALVRDRCSLLALRKAAEHAQMLYDDLAEREGSQADIDAAEALRGALEGERCQPQV